MSEFLESSEYISSNSEKQTFDKNYLKNFPIKEAFIDNFLAIDIFDGYEYNSEKINKIISALEEKGVEFNDIQKIEFNYSNQKLSIFFNGKEHIFQLNDEHIYKGTPEEANQESIEGEKKAMKLLESSEKYLDAIKEIIKQNNLKKYNKIDFNKDDILRTDEYGKEIAGKNARDIQLLLRNNIKELHNIPPRYREKLQKEILDLEKEYSLIILGIGSEYKRADSYLFETEEFFKEIQENILEASNSEILKYLDRIYTSMFLDSEITKTQRQNYLGIVKGITGQVLINFQEKGAKDEEFTEFAAIVSGRGIPSKDFSGHDFADPFLASKALQYIFLREGELRNTLEEGNIIKYEDKEVKDKNPKEILDDLENNFKELYSEELGDELEPMFGLLISGTYTDIFLAEDKSYDELSFSEKTQLSTLYRLNKELKNILSEKNKKPTFTAPTVPQTRAWRNNSELEYMKGYNYISTKFKFEYFLKVFSGIQTKYIEEVIGDIDNMLSSSNPFSKEFWYGKNIDSLDLSDNQKYSLKLFKDINGTGFFDLSDSGKSNSKFAGEIALILAISVIFPGATLAVGGGMAISGMVGAGVATYIVRSNSDIGYNTEEERKKDLYTDYGVNILTAGVGGKALNLSEKVTSFGKAGKTLFVSGDIFASGGAEIYRQHLIERYYPTTSNILLSDKEERGKEDSGNPDNSVDKKVLETSEEKLIKEYK